jgi:DNA-binding transcriptional LysR family regulator
MARPPVAIELRHLRYFLAVFEELHFGRAAEQLHIAQPPLSQAIRKLENELGVQLLQRTSRVVAPTEAGRALAEEARKVLAGFELAVTETRRAGGAGTTLRIGYVPYLPIGPLLRLLNALHEREPAWQTQVTHLFALDQLALLRRGELDLGIFPATEEHAEVATEPLFAGEPLAAFLPAEHRLAAKLVLGPADLDEEILLTGQRAANPALYDRMLALMQAAGYRFARVREMSGTSGRDLMLGVAGGLGITLALASLREIDEAGGIVIRRPLDPPLAMPDTVVAGPANAPRRLATLLADVRDVARELRDARTGEVCGQPRDSGR